MSQNHSFTTDPPSQFQQPKPKHHFKVHAAIDFGTDGVALAFAFGQCDDVKAYLEWSGRKYKAHFKPKAIVLLDGKNEVLAFGKDAKHTYMTCNTKKDEWMLFDKFKMALYDDHYDKEDDNDDDFALNDELMAANGKKLDASIVFVAVLKHLRKEAKRFFDRKARRLFADLDDKDIQWIITVPAIWNDAAKYQMREWAIEAGLVDKNIEDQCKVVYEPDCASLSIQYGIKNDQSQIRNLSDEPIDGDNNEERESVQSTSFSKGVRYILVDAGGGTVDIACHEVLGDGHNGEFGVKEILHPSGGAWGSCYIDEKFEQVLKEIFSAEWMEELQTEKPNVYIEVMDNFQKSKEAFYERKHIENHNVMFPWEFIDFMQHKLEECADDEKQVQTEGADDDELAHMVSECKLFGQSSLVAFCDDHLEISQTAWKIMFDHVMGPIIGHIKQLLENPVLKNQCKYLCLVGGLSTSKYFQKRMRETFGFKSAYKLRFIIPHRPILTVVEGAAYFGITPNYIQARVLQHTYGECVTNTLKSVADTLSQDFIEENKFYCRHSRRWWVRNCFKAIAHKNQTVHDGQIIKSYGIRAPKQNTATSTVMVSEEEQPLTKSDGKELGCIVTKFENADADDTKVTLEFHFFETILKAVVYRDKDPQNKQVKYITNRYAL